MKKRILSFLLAMAMTALYIPSTFAQEDVQIINVEENHRVVEQTENTESTLRMSKGYSFNVSGDGEYINVTDEPFSLKQDDIVTVNGAWEPVNAFIWIELKKDSGGDAVALLTRAGEPAELHIPSTGVYHLRVMSSSYDVSGTIMIEW